MSTRSRSATAGPILGALLVGLALGLVAGYAVARSRAPASAGEGGRSLGGRHEPGAATHTDGKHSPSGGPRSAAESARARLRADSSRRAPDADADADAAGAGRDRPVAPAGRHAAGSGSGSEGPGSAPDEAGPPSVAEARRRAEELRAEAEDALAARDGKRALALLRELAKLGDEGDASAIDLARRIARELNNGSAQDIGLTSYDYMKAMQSPEMVPLLKRALLDSTADPRFRSRAIDYLAFSPNEDTLPFVLSLLAGEHDPRVLEQMYGFLEEQADPAVGAALADALVARAAEGPEVRLSIIEALARASGDEATRALEAAATGDADAAVREAARVSLIARAPPVAGYLLDEVVPDSQAAAAGLRPGDILMTYNGVVLTREVDLGDERRKVPEGETVTLSVWREGRQLELTIHGGRIGVDGFTVEPRR